jgi:hypothetical protein
MGTAGETDYARRRLIICVRRDYPGLQEDDGR